MLIHFPEDAGKLFECFGYPAGERQVRFTSEAIREIKMADKIQVIARIRSSDDVMGLAMLSDALHHHSKRRETELILPYFPYARADRRFTDGDCFGLRVFLGMVACLGYDKVKTLDVHSDKTAKYITSVFEDVSPLPFIHQAQGHERTCLLAPDAGAVTRYGMKTLSCTKQRDSVTGKLLGFSVPNKAEFLNYDRILIYDDICDGGGTFIGIAQELRASGVTLPLYLYVTHGIFSKGLGPLLEHFAGIYTTNSFDSYGEGKGLKTFDCESLLVVADIAED